MPDGTWCTGRRSRRRTIPGRCTLATGRTASSARSWCASSGSVFRAAPFSTLTGSSPPRRRLRDARGHGASSRVRPVPDQPARPGAAGDASETPASTAATTAPGRPGRPGTGSQRPRGGHRASPRPARCIDRCRSEGGLRRSRAGTGRLRPQRPARRAWTRSCGPPGQQTRENAVRRSCPDRTALRAVGGVMRSCLSCVRAPTTDPQMRQGPERSDPLGALSGVLPAQRTSSRSWEPVVRASASWWWCAASSSAGVTGATRSSKKKRLIRSRVFSVAVILPLAFGWAGSTW